MPRNHPARTVDQEFGEIPFDRRAQQARLFSLEIVVERMRMDAVDVDLFEHGKTDVILAFAEIRDVPRIAWLLGAKLVAGKAEHGEAARRQLAMQRLQPLILRGEATFARRVDDEQDLPLELSEGKVLARQRLGGEIVDARHALSRQLTGSIGDGGTPPASIASPASRQRSSRKRPETICTPTGLLPINPVETVSPGRPRKGIAIWVIWACQTRANEASSLRSR